MRTVAAAGKPVNGSRNGFTLIELLVAAGIFSLIAIALYSSFFAGISVWRRSGHERTTYEALRTGFEDLDRDLRNSVYMSDDEESLYSFFYESSALTFMTLRPCKGAGKSTALYRVSYFYRDQCFMRTESDKESGFEISEDGGEVLCDGVSDMHFLFCYDTGDDDDPYEWKGEWDHEEMRLPRGLRVRAEVLLKKGPEDAAEFAKTFFIPTGVLGEEEL